MQGKSVSYPEVKRPGRVVEHWTPSSDEVKERVELYLYSPPGLYDLLHVVPWTLLFTSYLLFLWRSSAVNLKHINSAILQDSPLIFPYLFALCAVQFYPLCDALSLTVSTEHKLNIFQLSCSCKMLDLRWRQQQNTGERYIQKSFAACILIHVTLRTYRWADSAALRCLVYRLDHWELWFSPPSETRDLSVFRRSQSVSGGHSASCWEGTGGYSHVVTRPGVEFKNSPPSWAYFKSESWFSWHYNSVLCTSVSSNGHHNYIH